MASKEEGRQLHQSSLLVIICGASGSGKSSLASVLTDLIPCAVCVNQDSFFTQPFKAYSERTDDAFEGPVFVDWPEIERTVKFHHEDGKTVILEGHLVATRTALVSAAHVVVILEVSRQTCRARRVHRRARPLDEENILGHYYDTVVWPAFLKYSRPSLDRLLHERNTKKRFSDDDQSALVQSVPAES